MSIQPGAHLGPYVILEPLGAGGMGVVYRARHIKLERDVAIKVLSTDVAADRNRVARLEREARIASALNHPNIVTIHDIGEDNGVTYIAMEAIDGRTLADIIAEGRVTVEESLRLGLQMADALAKAHAAGIVHRDIKPANVMVTSDGLAKVLDFGIARPPAAARQQPIEPADIDANAMTATIAGDLFGTPSYMSPEQLVGGAIDHRADQFAFGATLYEMLAGRSAFHGPTIAALVKSILTAQPQSLRSLAGDIQEDIDRVVMQCLEKDAAQRFASMADVGAALRRIDERLTRRKYSIAARLRRPVVAVPLIVTLVLGGIASGIYASGAERRWAERDALDEISQHVENGEVFEAYRAALLAGKYRVDDPDLERLVSRFSMPILVNTDPPGAEVRVKDYDTPDAPWEYIGTTPLEMRNPYALMRWRITLNGYETVDGAPFSGPSLMALGAGLQLDSIGTIPAGTVRIPAAPFNSPAMLVRADLPALIPSFFLDRYETTNSQYRAFVEAGGYTQREWWPDPITRNGRVVSWEEAMQLFRDSGGQPGPSDWRDGEYTAGEDDHAVGGLSWFEAAAYCRFIGRALPTVYHWFNAIGQEQLSDILEYSNLDGSAKARVGSYPGIAAWGNYDMAGNVKEWLWNETDDGWRFLPGAAWSEPGYLFRHATAEDPWDRSATNGVRCASYPEEPPAQLFTAVTPAREYELPDAITDSEFELLRGMYALDPSPLEPRIERTDTQPQYRREVVSINTGYDRDRMEIHLLIPRDVTPPWQSVIWFPGDDVFLFQSSESFASEHLFDFVPVTGRVLVYPVYSGMYERWEPPRASSSEFRDRLIRWSQDMARTIDYLETRPDFDADRIAYYGFSGGAVNGPLFTAVEQRFSAAILLGGGLVPRVARPEAHPAHFATRTRTPTLMINGQNDFVMPYDQSQRPLFEMLGAPAEDKRHARLAGGHIPTHRQDIVNEVGDWLDRYLGPVRPIAADSVR